MTFEIQSGKPPQDGLYVGKCFYGWKLLEWYRGEWWGQDRHAKYKAEVRGWIGPIPGTTAAAMEFDL